MTERNTTSGAGRIPGPSGTAGTADSPGPSRTGLCAPSLVRVVLFFAATLLLGAGPAPMEASAQRLPTASPEDVGMSSERLERLDATMQRFIDDDLVAGTVTLVAREGKVVHLDARGHRWIEGDDPMDADDIFFIMSMTKPIASTALMMLFEEGHFLLDDPISMYLPDFADKEVLVETEGGVGRVPADGPITFRHVLTHTAGVDPDRDLLTEKERELLSRRTTLEETIRARAPLPLEFHPGEEWRYGSSTDYVAMLVEAISGRRFDRFLQERIFEPLGMHDTHYNVPDSKTDRVAAVYSPSGPDNTIELMRTPDDRQAATYFGGVYGLYSTAPDYFRFAQMILNGGELDGVRLLSPSTVNLMITNHTGDEPIYIRGADAYGFGLGFSMLTDPARSREALTPGSFGWGGAWGTVFWIDPTEETVMIFMTQISSYSHFTIRQEFPNLVMQALVESKHAGDRPIRAY
ncbi:MAG: serine hydrolase domain-containing protein [Gemmatimonadota bacterium]